MTGAARCEGGPLVDSTGDSTGRDTTTDARRIAGIERTVKAGLAHHLAGRLERAETLYRKALRKEPGHPQALHLLGVIAYQYGHNAVAIRLIERALPELQDVADAHLNYGNALLADGRAADAAACYRRALALQPDHGLAHSNLGRALNEQKRFDEGLRMSRRAAELLPEFPGAHVNCAAALIGLGRYAEAEAPLTRVAGLQTDNADICCDLGSVLTELGRLDEAMIWRERAIELNPKQPAIHYGQAVTLLRLGELERSAAAFRRAGALAPESAKPVVGLADVLSLQGRFAEATMQYRRALELDRELPDAHRGLAALGVRSSDPGEVDTLKAMLANPALPIIPRVEAGFAAGALLDNADRTDEAFPCFAQANALYRRHRADADDRYDAAAMQRDVDRVIEHCTFDGLAEASIGGSASDLPVFIVGMPRSGTSLIEQILASHSRVHGAGELRDLHRMVKEIQAQPQDDTQQKWHGELASRRAGEYLTRLQELGGDAARVIDKMPDNVFFLGPITLLFPAARIIICRRDIRDVCLSCYFRLFTEGNLWSYDLADCRHRALEVERLADHWLRALPGKVIEVDYAELVADLEGESRRLIEFLGLEWEPACLEFHRTERPVLTASHWQVRQPLYARSVGRWRSYERHLEAVFGEVMAV